MSDFAFFYTTVPNGDVGQVLAQALLINKLAACVNTIPQVTSFYWREGQVQKDEECILLIKSKSSLYEQIQEKILSLHPYKCPPILQIPIEKGSINFFKWMEETLQKERNPHEA